MVVDMFDIVPVGNNCEVAPLFPTFRVGRGEVEDAEPVLPGEGVNAAVAAVVAEGRGERVVDRCVGIVFDRECEKRDRHRRVTIVMRDKRAERRHPDLARKARMMELELSDRKAADERDVVKVGNSSHRIAIGAEAKSVELTCTGRTARDPLIGSVQHASGEQSAVLLCLDREMAVAVKLMDSRPVADAPVDQPAAAGQRHAAGADAAKWKGDKFEPFAGVNEAVIDGCGILQHSG